MTDKEDKDLITSQSSQYYDGAENMNPTTEEQGALVTDAPILETLPIPQSTIPNDNLNQPTPSIELQPPPVPCYQPPTPIQQPQMTPMGVQPTYAQYAPKYSYVNATQPYDPQQVPQYPVQQQSSIPYINGVPQFQEAMRVDVPEVNSVDMDVLTEKAKTKRLIWTTMALAICGIFFPFMWLVTFFMSLRVNHKLTKIMGVVCFFTGLACVAVDTYVLIISR